MHMHACLCAATAKKGTSARARTRGIERWKKRFVLARARAREGREGEREGGRQRGMEP